MRFCFLGSGSRGNSYIVEHANTKVLVDCGFSRRDMHRRLARLFLSPTEINAVLITHEHSDHTRGLKQFMPEIAVYMTHGTATKLKWAARYNTIRAEESFFVGRLQITPVAVPHDAAEPVQFVFADGVRKLAVFTDLGHITPTVRRWCADVDALAVECNYCPQMLADNPHYPPKLKSRIAGQLGHLENAQAAALISELKSPKLRYVIAAHLSEKNNTSFLAHKALSIACDTIKISIAEQQTGTAWLSL